MYMSRANWDLPNALSSGEIDVRSRLRVDFVVLRDNYADYSIDLLCTAADVIGLVLHGSNAFGVHGELLTCVDDLHVDVRASEAWVQSVELQVAASPAAWNSVPLEVTWLQEDIKIVHHQLSTTQSEVAV